MRLSGPRNEENSGAAMEFLFKKTVLKFHFAIDSLGLCDTRDIGTGTMDYSPPKHKILASYSLEVENDPSFGICGHLTL